MGLFEMAVCRASRASGSPLRRSGGMTSSRRRSVRCCHRYDVMVWPGAHTLLGALQVAPVGRVSRPFLCPCNAGMVWPGAHTLLAGLVHPKSHSFTDSFLYACCPRIWQQRCSSPRHAYVVRDAVLMCILFVMLITATGAQTRKPFAATFPFYDAHFLFYEAATGVRHHAPGTRVPPWSALLEHLLPLFINIERCWCVVPHKSSPIPL